ncbi:hypothetical protein CKO20_03860 [Rhodocyclus tenuis]|nr:hypothetical protein [Rhodocyclus tenuis]
MSSSSIGPAQITASSGSAPAPVLGVRLQNSARARVTLIALAVLIFALWGSALFASHFLRQDIERMLATQQFSAVSFVAADLDRELNERQRALQAVAKRMSAPLLSRDAAANAQSVLEERIALRTMFNWGLFVVGRDATAIASVPAELGRTGGDYSSFADVRAVLDSGQPRITDPLTGKRTGQPVISIVVPIDDRQGKVIGALIGVTHLGLPNFFDDLTAHRYGKGGGYLVIAPKSAVFVAATDRSRVMQAIPPPGNNANHDRFMAGAEGSGVAINSQGVEELASARRLFAVNWLVVAVLPTAEAFVPVHEMQQRLFVIATLLTIVGALIAWLVLHYELAPLAAISRRLRAMSRGEVPRQALPIARNDEIGDVAASVNALIASIESVEGALRESEARFRELADAAPVLIWMAGLDKRCDYFNRAWLEFTGRTFAQEFGNGWVEGVHPDDVERCFTTYESAFDARRRFTMEYRLHHHDGSHRWLLDNGAPRFDGAGNFVGYIGSCVDIDALKRAEQGLRASDSLNRSILDSFSECVCVLDADGTIIRVNDAWRRLADGPSLVGAAAPLFGDSLGADYFSLCPNGLLCASDAECEREAVTAIADVLAGRCQSARIEYVCSGRQHEAGHGENHWFELRVRRLDDREGAVIAHDEITSIKRADELQIAAAAFQTQEGIIITDAARQIIRVNDAFTRLTGYGAAEAIGQTPTLLKSGRHDQAFYREMYETLAASGFWQGEIWNRRKDGSIYPQWMTITAVFSAAGGISHYVGAFSDISERKQAEAQIHSLAFFDPLTGLPNRRLLRDRLAQALAASARHGRWSALMFLDLDHFKLLNDTRGHEIGDQLLSEVARRLDDGVREGDTVARLGGDEFIVMLEDLDSEPDRAANKAEAVAEKLRLSIAQPFLLRAPPRQSADAPSAAATLSAAVPEDIYHCTCSIGLTLFQGNEASIDDLLRHADVAMYQAKAASRNTVRFFDPQMQAALDARTRLEAGLRRAITQGELRLHYQWQVDVHGLPIGVEALARWQDPERGMVSPAEFIPLAEETGLIIPLGEWALREACRQLVVWSAAPAMRALCVSVNVSRRQFRQAGFADVVRRAVTGAGADPARLKLELTESVLDDVDAIAASMRDIGAIGVGFSLDDFGTGYSSLSCLRHLPLDQLKIDQSFVRGLGSDDDSAAIVRAVIALGQGLGLEVIAEGVETEAQYRLLVEYGCTAFQGYLFGRPQAAENF